MKDLLEEQTKNERKFLDEEDTFKNEHGVYLFVSADGSERINLSFFLKHYKDWLIENKILRL